MLPAYAARWRETPAAGARLLNAYGPTETVVTATTFDVSAGFRLAAGARAVPIGRPFGRRSAYVLDAALAPVPLGVAGELFLGGAPVARGYLGRPALTAERFVPDPFGGAPGGRLYRTGDLARRGDDGALAFLGRADRQVKVRGFRIEPGEVEAALERHPGVREAVVVAREDEPGEKRLAAYLVAAEGAAPEPAALREHLLASLPEHMVPGAFVRLERLPLTPAGKVDRAALPAPERAGAGHPYAAPRSATEEVLAGIFARVLKLERVGIHDPFFELGGDSIISIQVVARARAAGLHLVPRHVFEHPTVAGLAAVCGDAGEAARAEQGQAGGAVELTPGQAAFLSRGFGDPHRFTLSRLFELRRPLDPGALERAVPRLVEHHDALGMRFRRVDGEWRQENAGAASAVAFDRFDLRAMDEAGRRAALEAEGARLAAGLDLERGPLLRMAHFDFGAERGGRLLVVAHPLVMDAASWRVLMDDLRTALEQVEAGEEVRLPGKAASFQAWAARLAAHAREGGFDGELDFWAEAAGAEVPPLPLDFAGAAQEAEGAVDAEAEAGGAAGCVIVELDEEETRALLHEVPRAYRTRAGDALLAALARALTAWTGGERVRVELEGDGREARFAGVDASRTMGWLTSPYPVVLDLSGAEGEAGALKAVKERLRSVPGGGIGFGALRWLAGDAARARLEGVAPAQVRFEYLGELDETVDPGSPFAAAAGPAGAPAGPGRRAGHPLRVSAAVRGGRLRASLGYSEARFRRERIEEVAVRFAAELRALIAHCATAGAGGYTPSDFPLARLDQARLDRVTGGRRDVEDVYPLSSTQEGILFHSHYAPGEGVYVGQFCYDLVGALDLAAFERAWAGTLERHPALRTGFVSEGVDTPVQVVRGGAGVPMVRDDWRALAPDAQEARRQAFLAEDRARGFDLAEPPLVRVALFRTADDRHHLVCTQHHLVLDGWSLPLVFRDLAALYGAYAEGRPAQLAPARPYRDFVAWLQERRPDQAERFWREALDGFAAPTPLGVDTPDAAAEGYGRETLRLAPEAAARLEAAARRGGLTLNTLLQGAWALVLSRYGGEEDVVFGATLSGRPAEVEGVEGIVGIFINTLPVRVRVSPGARVLPWLRALQGWNAAMQEHQNTPLTRVWAWSALPAGAPLFESILAFQNYPVGESLGGGERGLLVEARSVDVSTHYPLALTALPGNGLVLNAAYRRSRLGAGAVARMLAQLSHVLERFAEEPGARLDEIELVGAGERRRLLERSAGMERGYPHDACVHELFEARAREAPGAVALRWDGAPLTYGELDARANRLAHHLAGLGVGPEARVGVLLERGPELIVSLLAILKAGGCYVPLDPAYPPGRLELMLADCGARVVLSRSGLRGAVAGAGRAVVCLDEIAGALASAPAAAPRGGASAGNLAFVVYTSGSTGRPKGVMGSHREVVQLAVGAGAVRLGPGDRVAQASNASFDALTFEVWGALLNGAALVGAPRDTLLSAPALGAFLRAEGITTIFLTTALLNQLTREQPGLFAGVRELLFGGEAVDAGRIRAVLAAGRPRRLLHIYGPTEATAYCTCGVVEEVAAEAATVPIGVPIANARVYLLDAVLNPAPAGVPGEAYVGGAGVARGYLGRPALTALRFVPDPFAGRPGARMYRTGDRMRWTEGGALEFAGRLDAQVKLRGFRIEPGEVEAALSAHPGVREARVVVREDEPGEKRLVAYVVGGADAGGVDAGGLRAHLRRSLPEHMVPGAFVALERLPLTPNGKLDEKALPAPEDAAREEGQAQPRTPVEEVLAGIWAEVLRLERVGVEDSFFELGGHSLLATRIVSRVREVFAVELPLRALFEGPTVAEVAREVEALRRAGLAVLPPVARADRSRPLPLSFPQERLWFVDRAEDAGGSFTIPFGVRIEGEGLDPAALERAFAAVVERHEVLRTVFPAVDGEGRQVVLESAPFVLPRGDLRGRAPEEAAAEVARLAAELAERPYDLERGPLLRALLLRTAAAEHVLLVNLHHIVFDGWSAGVLVRELTACYEALRAGRAPALPPLAVQYADYAAWQRAWAAGDAAAGQLLYWKRQLAGLPTLDLRAGRPRPDAPGYHGGALAVELGPALSERARAAARGRHATLFMFLLAAFKVALAHHGRTRDLVVGTDVAGRVREEVEPLVGFFINEVVLRTDLSGDPSLDEVVGRVRGTALDAYRNQETPFALLARELAGERGLGATPLFQVMFGLDNTPAEPVEVDGLRLASVASAAAVSPWELSLYVRDTAGGIAGAFRYRTELVDAELVDALRADFLAVVEALCATPGLRLEALLARLAAAEGARWEERARMADEAGRLRLKGLRRQAVAVPAE
jgi:amino acid adenylation domain-containing protein/non-ribosomal peptide synthase protein (TIGR01720 family)